MGISGKFTSNPGGIYTEREQEQRMEWRQKARQMYN